MLTKSPRELALLISNERKKLKLSQTEVGNLVGLKQKTISALENKPEKSHINTLFRVLSALNLEIQISSKNESAAIKNQWKEEW